MVLILTQNRKHFLDLRKEACYVYSLQDLSTYAILFEGYMRNRQAFAL